MGEEEILRKIQSILARSVEERRGFVAFSRLEAREMDRMARERERKAIEEIRAILPEAPFHELLSQVLLRIQRMDEQLQALEAQEGISEASRQLERDEITWQAFEDLCGIVGLV
ncbi:MAG: hypothetical protein QN198_05405 [Armatimonadota bacterium]|nr:hypothetical protein [Armatimonadota bacterium]MDR5703023.1 hypothetical protein [Armatimonadota bacterium]MDR7434197.1 hypothetical protein [Armatimonadota bacterium]